MVADSRLPEERTVRVEDLLPLRSRVSWPAIFAGSVLALAVFFVLTLLGGAVGMTVYDNVSPNTLNTGAAVWAIASTIIALFVGGWLVSQATVGENKCEAAMHGIIMWGVVFAMLVGLSATGVRAGFNAMVGVASVMDRNDGSMRQNWESYARQSGATEEQVNRMRDAGNNAGNKLNDVANDPAARDRVATAAWWTLFGVLLSMASALAGALVGAGPTIRLLSGGFHPVTTVRAREAAVR